MANTVKMIHMCNKYNPDKLENTPLLYLLQELDNESNASNETGENDITDPEGSYSQDY